MKDGIELLLHNEMSPLLAYNCKVLKEFKQICNPLLKHFPITDLLYGRFFKNGHYFLLSTDVRIVDSFISYKQVYDINFFKEFNSINKDKVQACIWSTDIESALPELKMFPSSEPYYGLNAACRRKEDESIETFIFYTKHSNNGMYNFYINNFDILVHFIYYFRIRASKIIENYTTKKLAYSSFYRSEMQRLETTDVSQELALLNYLDGTKLQSYPFATRDGQEVILSERQTECLYHMANGKTAKETARYLGISYRTVQTHLNIVNEKLGACSKATAIECFPSNIRKLLEFSHVYQSNLGPNQSIRPQHGMSLSN